MKKALKLILLVLTTCTMFSCTEDREIAYALDGIWEGEVATEYFNYRWQEWGVDYQMVDIEFYTDPRRFASGEGVEYDYTYINEYTGRCEYIECGFTFKVQNEYIYIYYDDGTDVVIRRNFILTDRVFEGEFLDRYGRHLADFKFVKVNNWRYKRGGYTYYGRSGDDKEIDFVKVPSPALKK